MTPSRSLSDPSRDTAPITREDLTLLGTPDVEIREKTAILSFDQKSFEERISIGDKWQQLMQAHLYFDHVVTQLLIDDLADPEAINIARMNFAQKLSLVKALGLLSGELVSIVEHINKIRNRIAHVLDFVISWKEEQDLRNTTPKYLRDAVLADSSRKPGAIQFYELLLVALLKIEVIRQEHECRRLLNRKAEIRLRTVLEKTPDAVYRE